MTEPHALNLAGLTILHRTLLSAHIERAGLITAAPWFRDSWVSIDDLTSLDDAARVKLLALLDRFATEYGGTSVGREFAHVRNQFDQIMHTVDDGSALLAYGETTVPARPECGGHKPVQHRDGKPPWCHKCGLTADGHTPVSVFERRGARMHTVDDGALAK